MVGRTRIVVIPCHRLVSFGWSCRGMCLRLPACSGNLLVSFFAERMSTDTFATYLISKAEIRTSFCFHFDIDLHITSMLFQIGRSPLVS